MAFSLTLLKTSGQNKSTDEIYRMSQHLAMQYDANRRCMALAKVEGFLVGETIYCKAVFNGQSQIISYEELDRIVNPHQ